jgi:hypothetical protein
MHGRAFKFQAFKAQAEALLFQAGFYDEPGIHSESDSGSGIHDEGLSESAKWLALPPAPAILRDTPGRRRPGGQNDSEIC